MDHAQGLFPAEAAPSIPDSYGDNRLVLLTRDPLCFFSYWEFTPDRIDKLRQDHGADVWDRGILILRVYDVTHFPQDGVGSASHFDVDLPHRDTRQFYVKVEQPGHSYIVELGLRQPDGRFLLLLRSNRVRLPAGRVSDKTDLTFMSPGMNADDDLKQFQKLAEGVENIGGGSAEFAKGMAQRWEFLKSVYSGTSSTLSNKSDE